MEKPPSFVVTPIAAPAPLQFTKLSFRALYIRRSGPSSREISMDGASSGLGKRYFSDFPVYDGPGSGATVVARVQGVAFAIGNTHQTFTIVFETDRFKGSTLLTNGVLTGGSDEWAIYGGTGVFAMASGVIKRKYVADRNDGNTDELTMDVFCPVLVASQQPNADEFIYRTYITKIGLWGGEGGFPRDMATEPPRRLQSITIRSGNAIDCIAFTYTDKAGQKHTAGPWGGNGGTAQKIDLDDAEYVKEVSGTYNPHRAVTTLTSFKLVTSVRTWGPWGVEKGTRFCITAPAKSSVVGFYARTGSLVDAIGVYLRQLS